MFFPLIIIILTDDASTDTYVAPFLDQRVIEKINAIEEQLIETIREEVVAEAPDSDPGVIASGPNTKRPEKPPGTFG